MQALFLVAAEFVYQLSYSEVDCRVHATAPALRALKLTGCGNGKLGAVLVAVAQCLMLELYICACGRVILKKLFRMLELFFRIAPQLVADIHAGTLNIVVEHAPIVPNSN